MPKLLTPAEIKQSVDPNFEFLAHEYGFEFKFDKNEYVAETISCRIAFAHEWGIIDPCIKPIGDAAQKLKRFLYRPGYIPVVAIAICSDPSFQFNPPDLDNYNPQDDLKEVASLAKKYCLKYIQGDFSGWKEIEDCAQGK